jgi:lysozyme
MPLQISSESKEKLINRIKQNEGFEPCIYTDSRGYKTVGFGRNLDTKGLTLEESIYLLNNDLKDCERNLLKYLKDIYSSVNDARKTVLIELCFNLGITGLMQFKKFLSCLSKKDYESARLEMLDSIWAKQVGGRADRLAHVMETGVL